MDKIKFEAIDKTGYVADMWPIEPASRVEYIGKEIQSQNEERLAHCPGMHDYKNVGWIMRAWDDFQIYVSDNNSMAYYGNPKVTKTRGTPFQSMPEQCPAHFTAGGMNSDIIAGFEGRDDKFNPLHFTSPWMISGDVSLMVLPPVYHSNVSQIVDIFPGIVDYNKKFTTLNFICSPKKKGQHVIKAGTPILHLIPIQKGDFECEIRFGEDRDKKLSEALPARITQFYRKHFMKRSRYEVKNKL